MVPHIQVAEKRRVQRLGAYKGDVRNTQLPNDVSLLLDLVSKGLLIGTPPQVGILDLCWRDLCRFLFFTSYKNWPNFVFVCVHFRIMTIVIVFGMPRVMVAMWSLMICIEIISRTLRTVLSEKNKESGQKPI